MPLILIGAMSEDRVIGRGDGMPWDVPVEYDHYLSLVRGHPIIMGRRSFGIFGADLPDDTVIVLSRSVQELPGARVARSLDAAVALGRERSDTVFVAGGGRVYAQALERADAMYLSTIRGDFDGDTYFPAFDPSEWALLEEVDHGPFVFRFWARPGGDTGGLEPQSATRGAAPWVRLGAVEPVELTSSRINLHWAAQLVGAAGRHLVEARPDESHTNLLWSSKRRGFQGRRLPSGHHVFLDVETLRVCLLDETGAETAALDLPGQTMAGALDWLSETLAGAGNEVGDGIEAPDYDLPEHPVQQGGVFAPADPEPLRELALWLGNARSELERVRQAHEGASEVRCWPHHFDIATLVALDPDIDDAESARSVGVGLSPGDAGYPQPYFYVTPWPYPDNPSLPDLPGGHWHREGWLGAVLTGQQIVALGDATHQRAGVRAFVAAAVAAALALLQSADPSSRTHPGMDSQS